MKTRKKIATQYWRKKLRKDIRSHLGLLHLKAAAKKRYSANGTFLKKAIRRSHRHQKAEIYTAEKASLKKYWTSLPWYFANGDEIDPNRIEPYLVPVESNGITGALFRFASLLWSVPVSKGYGRRMRYLVFDKQNQKLIGLFALGDPVFNLKVRDNWIGWTVNQRKENLVNVMDAYVAGAVPPYNRLLCGKMVFSLIGSSQVSSDFAKKYSASKGKGKKRKDSPRLVLVTVTSALGRSSLYNRLKLKETLDSGIGNKVIGEQSGKIIVQLVKLGETSGYGHFHLSNSIFERLRILLDEEKHPYANGYKYGMGPNWRFRVIRVGLSKLGLSEELLHHGILREVFAMPLTSRFRLILRNGKPPRAVRRPTVRTIGRLAKARWIMPRSQRDNSYKDFKREEILSLVRP